MIRVTGHGKYLAGMIPLILSFVLAGCAPKNIGKWSDPAALREELQEPLKREQADSLSGGPSIKQAIGLALERNPGVAATRRRWLAAIQRAPQARSLPDPRLQAGYQFDSVETRVGPQDWNVGLTQKIPWWQKLWARGKRAEKEAAITQLKYEAAARDLIIEVKDAYYELYYLDQAIPITQEISQTLREDGLLAYSELDTGRTQLGEAFRAESQAAQLGYDLILLREQRASQAERLRSLLNLPPETSIGRVERAPLYEVSDDISGLHKRAENYAEVLRISGLEVEKAQYDKYLAKLTRIPDVGIGFNYISTGAARAGNPSDSGKDPFIGLLSMNLPIWENRTQALIREKEAIEEAMKRQALEDVNRTREAVAKAYFRTRLTRRLAHLYEETLLPQADAVMGQAETNFRAGEASFSNLLETTLAYHNFLLAYHRAIADHGQALGTLEKAIGTTAEPRQRNAETGG